MRKPAIASIVALSIGALAVPRSAFAGHRAETADYPLEFWRIELGVNHLNVASGTFVADGHYPNGGGTAHLAAPGRSLGLRQPWVFTITTHMAVQPLPHFTLGALVEVGGGNIDGTRDAVGMGARTGDGISFFRAGAEVGTVWATERFDFRVAMNAGVRSIGVPVYSFEPHRCKSGLCYPTADFVSPYVQGRMQADILFGKIFAVGVYGGIDVAPDASFTFGIMLAAHLPRWTANARE